MNIDREKDQLSAEHSARDRVDFCLDQLERAPRFSKGISWDTRITARLTLEEMIGALVSAGQQFAMWDTFPDDGNP